MRKELPGTYTELGNGAVGMKARTPSGEILEYEIAGKDLSLDVNFTDKQGTPKVARVALRPVVSRVTRIDKIVPEGIRLFYVGALNCYTGLETDALIQKALNDSEEVINEFLDDNVVQTNHWSILEHHGPSFMVERISRACSHQLVRHRFFTHSQRSQRYLDYANPKRLEEEMVFPFIIPPSIRANPDDCRFFINAIKYSLACYYTLRHRGILPEDARFLFAEAVSTRTLISGNLRAWMEMVPKRTCARAQWEADMVVTEIARQLHQESPVSTRDVGPACSNGKCDQRKRSCGTPLSQPLSAFFQNEVYPHDRLIFGMR